MPDSDAVLVALTGAVLSAPAGTAGPADPTTAWAAAWVNLGWISEDGVTESYSDDSNEIKAWQGGTTVRTVITGSTATYQFTAIETNKEVLARYHKGSNVTADVGNTFSTIEIASAQADSRAWGFDVIDGTNHIRIVLERAEVTERGDITYNSSDAIGYEMTVTAYPNDTGIVAVKMVDSDGFATALAARGAAAEGRDLDLDRLIEERRAAEAREGER
jgi:hypothetical protein